MLRHLSPHPLPLKSLAWSGLLVALLGACSFSFGNSDDEETTAPVNGQGGETGDGDGDGDKGDGDGDGDGDEPSGCSASAVDGSCSGDQVVYCQDASIERLDCSVVGETCGLTGGRADCEKVERFTACGELSPLGDCQGDDIRWCDESRIMAVPVQYDCSIYGQECDPTAAADGGAVCVSHGACGDVDADGTCDGNTLSYCDGGELFVFDCGEDVCEEVGGIFDCFTAGALSACDEETRCEGDEVVQCLGGVVTREDCAALGMECAGGADAACVRRDDCGNDCASGYTCEDGLCTGPADADLEWTVALYMVGDNNLSNAVWQDLNELETLSFGNEIQVVAEFELSDQYTSLAPDEYRSGAYRLAVQGDNDTTVVSSMEASEELGDDVDMSDPEHLAQFARWAAESYPSKRFALIFWDHGFGWRGGFVDSRSSGVMSLRDIVAGVRDSGTNPDLVGFDACLMGMHEVALALRGVTDTLVASEEAVPGGGYPYGSVFQRLLDAPASTPSEFGQAIAEEYTSYFDEGLRARSTTMSVLDLREVETANDQLASFSQAVVEDLPGRRSEVRGALRSGSLLRFKEKDSADLISTMNVFEDLGGEMGAAAADFMSYFDTSGLVLFSEAKRQVAEASGLAIHLPANAFSLYTSDNLEDYRESTGFLALEPWHGVLANFTELPTAQGDGADTFTITLSWADSLDGDSSGLDLDLIVVEPSGEEAASANGAVTSNGLLSADSVDSLVPNESYELRPNHQPGIYVVLVDLFQNADTPDDEVAFPKVTIDIDGDSFTRLRGHSDGRTLVQIPMDTSAPFSGSIDSENVEEVLDHEYSTLWYVTSLQVK